MATTEINSNPWMQRAAIAAPLFLGVAALLVACGGGESTPTASSQSSGREQALAAVATSASVPSGWKPRVPAPEVINGIVVPPEPAPSVNDSTLAGIDSNNNGVRDDVERFVARAARSPAEGKKILAG